MTFDKVITSRLHRQCGLEDRYDIAARFEDTTQYAGSKAGALSGVDVEKQNLAHRRQDR